MTRNLELLKEKVNALEPLIEQIEQDILDPNVLTGMALRKLIATCNNLINRDF